MISKFSPTKTRMVVLRHARQVVEFSLLRNLLPFMLTEETCLCNKMHNSCSRRAVLSYHSGISQALGALAGEGFDSACSMHTVIETIGPTVFLATFLLLAAVN